MKPKTMLKKFRAFAKRLRKPYVAPRYTRYRRRSGFRQFMRKVFFYGALFGVVSFAWLSFSLPNIDDLDKITKARSILIKSEDGQIVGSFGDIYGDFVKFDEMPASLVDAVLATEDRNFYHHFGIDPAGLARATLANLRARRVVQGGSTITQQVAKNVFLTPERSFSRKIREMILAIKLENRFSKQDIMSIYLNRVYLGAGSYGVDAAARRYFDKPAQQLTLSESAILAGLLKAPSRFAPTSNPALARKRAQQVLLNMKDAGYLTQPQADKAIKELEKAMGGRQKSAQSTLYFADWIMDQLPEYVGNVEEDLVVTTTLRPDWQMIGEKAMADVMDKEGEPHKASQAALLAMTPDGAVRVMIGGRNYGVSQYNRVAQAFRQPGSSFKLFVYLAGLESGYTPDTLVEDEPITVPLHRKSWSPKNYTGKYLGTIPLRLAVAESINTVAVQVSQQVGVDHVIDVARRLGITSDLDPVPSIALGSTEVNLLELTSAYAHLASGGVIVNPFGIRQIETKAGELVYQRRSSGSGVVLSANVVGMMNDMLMGVTTQGTGRGAQIGRPIAGKTGTTSDYRDAWFLGYTPDLVTGVWVGNDDNTAMKKVTGGMLPAMIWRGFMRDALANTSASGIPTVGLPSPLPWQPDQTGFHPEASTVDSAPPERDNRPQRSNRDVELGPSFWDKLLGKSPPPRRAPVEQH